MIKGLTIKDSGLTHKVAAICGLKFNISATEQLVLCSLIYLSINNTVCLSVEISRQIQESTPISPSSLSTCIFRLQEKDVIRKSGKTITLNLIFHNIQEMDKLLITFQPPDNG